MKPTLEFLENICMAILKDLNFQTNETTGETTIFQCGLEQVEDEKFLIPIVATVVKGESIKVLSLGTIRIINGSLEVDAELGIEQYEFVRQKFISVIEYELYNLNA